MGGALSVLSENAWLVVGALFPVVNPIGNTPIFLALARGVSAEERAVLAKQIALFLNQVHSGSF